MSSLEVTHDLHVTILTADEPVERFAPFDPSTLFWFWRWFGVYRESREDDLAVATAKALSCLFSDDSFRFGSAGAFSFPEFLRINERLNHIAGPRLFHLFVQINQFSQQMGPAQEVSAEQSVVGIQKIVDQFSTEPPE